MLAAIVTVWVTLNADFLAYPGWLAAQKADFILGPVFIGLYWMRRRPRSRFGPILIAFGFVGAVYVLQSSSNPWLFGPASSGENVIYLATLALILTFPTGRLDGWLAKLILLAAFVVAAAPADDHRAGAAGDRCGRVDLGLSRAVPGERAGVHVAAIAGA